MRRFNGNAILAIVACLGLILSACGGVEGDQEAQRGGFGGKADSNCMPVMCELYCEHGFETDENGCEVCKCKKAPEPCLPIFCGLYCEFGYEKDENGCDLCKCKPAPCLPVMCELYCEHGFEKDENGCDICKCKPAPCPPVMCMLYCEHGFQKDENGCDICKCKPAPCPPVMCMLYCEDGFEKDANGCDICKCKAPERKVATGACVKNSFDSCTTDADCVAGGCGGELCYNPAFTGGASTCECVQPTGVSCGCVNGKCAWWN
jgi:hypothetical protein